MITFVDGPVYFNCFHFDRKKQEKIIKYRLDNSKNPQYPFQLFRWEDTRSSYWADLSTYSTVNDSVGVLLRELFSEDLAEEIYHGQAFIDPTVILEKIHVGDKSISIYASGTSQTFVLGRDIALEDLVRRKSSDVGGSIL